MDSENTRLLHGRIIQNTNQVYMLPADEPEIERLDLQHHLYFLAIEALCWPMEEVRRVLTLQGSTAGILDIGSGSGRWAVEMAKEFPRAEVVGIDLAPKKPSDTPENCRFELLDVEGDNLSHLRGSYDVVHCRGVGVNGYETLFKRAAELVKPGGFLLVVEPELNVYDEEKHLIKPAYAGQEPRSGSWLARIMLERRNRVHVIEGLLPTGIAPSIAKWLGENTCLDTIKQKSLYIPIGWQGGDDIELGNREEVGKLMQANLLGLPQAFRPGLLAAGMAVEELDACIRENETDLLQSQAKNYVLVHWFAAQATVG